MELSQDVVVDVEFEVIADDLHAVGRTMTSQGRSPTLPHAVVVAAIGAVIWWFGNPIGGAIMVAFAVVIYANPRIGFLDRWWARRMAGNRIGSRWRMQAGPRGIDYESAGLSGHVDWHAVESVKVSDDAMVIMGTHNAALFSIPSRAMTPWQVAALLDLVKAGAPHATMHDAR